MSKALPPVIILGMHRSGTTMVCGMLEQLGLFVGDKKDDNNESLFFYKLNNWAASVGFARYDYPHNLALMNPNCQQEVVAAFSYHLGSWRRQAYLGWGKFFQYKDIRQLDMPWGWKEPQNIFMLDFWKEIFPEARIIHIYRNPIDCTASFLERDLERRNRFELNWKKRLKRNLLIGHKYHQNFRLNTLQDGYELWAEYVDKAISWESVFGERMLSVKYEDFLSEPVKHLVSLAAFAGLDAGREKIENVARSVKADRKYAFLQHEAHHAFYQSIKDQPLMRQLGYDNLQTGFDS
jgi:hypothetical protein